MRSVAAITGANHAVGTCRKVPYRSADAGLITRETAAMWTFDKFSVGEDLGSQGYVIGADDVAEWYRLFGGASNENAIPGGLLATFMMRGYMDVIPDRPPGNIHASQVLHWQSSATTGVELKFELKCVGKRVVKARNWVEFEATISSAAGTHLSGKIESIWAQ